MRSILFTSGLLIGCNTGFKDPALAPGLGPDAGTEESCDAIARTISPASAGQSNFFYRNDVAFSVTSGAETASIHLVSSDGTLVTGSTWIDDRVAEDEPELVRFTPDEPLKAQTDYTATLDYCAGTPSVTFRTSELGSALEAPDRIEGFTYTMDLSSAKVVQPSGAAQVLLTLLNNDLALQVESVDNDTLDITVAPTRTSDGEQNTCSPSLDFSMPGNFAEAPAFEVGPVDVPFDVAGYTVMLYDGYSSATFASDGSFFAGGKMSGFMDARDVVIALEGRGVLPSEDPDAFCDLLANHNMGCTACADGEEYCLSLEVADIRGEQTDLTLEPIDETDCHEDCENSCDNDECDIADEFEVCES